MKVIVIAGLLALSFLTGFTCSKNTPEAQQAPAAPAQTQEQMAAPTAPADANAAAQPATPAPADASAQAAPEAAPTTTK